MSLKIYEYKNCGTCRKATKFLDAHGVVYKTIPVRETPPTKAELKKMLSYMDGEIRKLLNTSSQDYRELNLKDKLTQLKPDEVFDLLQKNGNLVKRPFVMAKDKGWVGFKEDVWKQNLGL